MYYMFWVLSENSLVADKFTPSFVVRRKKIIFTPSPSFLNSFLHSFIIVYCGGKGRDEKKGTPSHLFQSQSIESLRYYKHASTYLR